MTYVCNLGIAFEIHTNDRECSSMKYMYRVHGNMDVASYFIYCTYIHIQSPCIPIKYNMEYMLIKIVILLSCSTQYIIL